MYDDIIMRGKLKTGDWVYWNAIGELVNREGTRRKKHVYKKQKCEYIHELSSQLLTNTVGRYECKDIHGLRCYTNDVLRRYDGSYIHVIPVVFCPPGIELTGKILYEDLFLVGSNYQEINKHE